MQPTGRREEEADLLELLEATPEETARALGGPGRAQEVWRCVRKGRDPFAPGSLSPGAQGRLSRAFRLSPPAVLARSIAEDGTTKLLLGLATGGQVECVLVPGRGRTTVCVSTQVGCARGCTFCLTATMGLEKNLTAAEIVGQVHLARLESVERGLPRLRNVVFMGMGEPLDNLRAVQRAIAILTDNRALGFAPRHVTLSTVGPSARAIDALRGLEVRIAWSLHSASERGRRSLVPTAREAPSELATAFRAVFRERRDPLFVEITLMAGVNDAAKDAAGVVELLRDFPVPLRFNLLPMNPTPGSTLSPSPPAAATAYRERLREAGHFASIRRARGADGLAACGQLRVVGC